VEIIYQNRRGRPPLAYCCHLVLVVGCSDLFPHLDAQQMVEEVLQQMGGRCCNKREGVATVWRGVAMDGQKVLQQMVEEVLQRMGRRCCNKRSGTDATNGRGGWVLQRMVGRCCNKRERWDGNATDGQKVLQQTLGDRCNKWERWVGIATDGRKVLQQTGEVGRECNRWAEGVATDDQGGVATGRRKVLQQMLGDRCNKQERWVDIATDGRKVLQQTGEVGQERCNCYLR